MESYPHQSKPWRAYLWVCLGLCVITFAVFAQTARFDFLNFDDNLFVSGNPKLALGLSREGVAWAFSANLTHHAPEAEYWAPLTALSRLADYQLYGLAAGGHHVTSVLLHLVAGLVLFGALVSLTHSFRRSALIAALFLIHPLHVEPVAWLSARKDVLNGLFYFATLWAYGWYAARPSWRRYLLVFASFLCANMAKPMAVSLPLVLLLLDYWPLGRVRLDPSVLVRDIARRIAEKVPLLCIVVGVSFLAWIGQQQHGAMGDSVLYPAWVRLGNAAISYCLYIARTLFPAGLAVFYPHPGTALSGISAAGAMGCLLLLSVFCVMEARRRPWLFVGWFWFVIVLLPVSGIVQIGEMAMADRYSYVAQTGLMIAGVWSVCEWLHGRRGHAGCLPSVPSRTAVFVAAFACLLILGIIAYFQTATWKNSITVFTRAIQVTDDNYIAETNLAAALHHAGRVEEGRLHYLEAVRIRKPVLDYNLKQAARAEREGNLGEAIHNYGKYITLIPSDAGIHQKLGELLLATNEHGKAIVQFNRALRCRPEWIAPKLGISRVLIAQGNVTGARAALTHLASEDSQNLEVQKLLTALAE